jgi:3-isopropylmalate dehydratase
MDRTSIRDPKKSMSSQIFQADSRAQIEALEDNVKEFGLTYFGFGDRRQGAHSSPSLGRAACLGS